MKIEENISCAEGDDKARLYELMGAARYALGDGGGAAAAYFEAARSERFLSAQLKNYSAYLFCLHYVAELKDELIAREHFRYGDMLGQTKRFEPLRVKRRGEKLKIGYLSCDFHEHTTARFLRRFFTCASRDKFSVYAFYFGEKTDEVTQEFMSLADEFVFLDALYPLECAKKIREREIDILFDLAGHTAGGASLMTVAHKPAPVQISGIGWFDTTGLNAIDYFLTDKYCLADGEETQFSETPLVLSRSHFCWSPSVNLTKKILPEYEPRDIVNFASFNNFTKLTDEMLALWKEILLAVPNARLLLKDTTAYAERRETLRRRLERNGFDLSRVMIESGTEDYLKDYERADIMLDTFPYTGGGTTLEAISSGVPVVSRYDRRHGTRFGLSILSNLSLAELAAPSDEEYVKAAVSLALNKEKLTYLHNSLADILNASALVDGAGYMRELEALYEEIYEDYRRRADNG